MCRSKALLYVCTHCRKKGSVIKCLHEDEVENTRVHKQRLASVQTNERLSELVGELREEKQALVLKQEPLEAEIRELQKQLVNSMHVTKPISSIEVPRQSSEQDREEPENQTTPVETSGQSESGETSDSSSSWRDLSERTR